jgi:hypothetical protein
MCFVPAVGRKLESRGHSRPGLTLNRQIYWYKKGTGKTRCDGRLHMFLWIGRDPEVQVVEDTSRFQPYRCARATLDCGTPKRG